MKKGMTIFYKVHNGLYVNLTNKCPCACTFCLRQNHDQVGEADTLWLEHEPDLEEIKAELSTIDLSQYDEVVFCGFGEPTERLDVLLATASYIKSFCNIPIRINTNGLGNLIHERDITPELADCIDTVSISLNTPDKEHYNTLVRSRFGDVSFQAMLDFAKACTRHVSKVIMTTVATTLTKEEEEACAKICKELGVTYRIRPWEA